MDLFGLDNSVYMPEGWHPLPLEIQNNALHRPCQQYWQSLLQSFLFQNMIIVMSVVKVMDGLEQEVNENSEQ